MPRFSRGVGVVARVEAGCVDLRGEAWAIAMRQARKSIVRGEGEGIGEEEAPMRWIVCPLLLGVLV